jgi:signal recognition particle receptor subunit beta
MYINWKRKELVITIALYGPPGGGKTTTWQRIAEHADVVPDSEDTVRLYLEDIQGKQLILNVRDTLGAPDAASQRRIALYGVDGVIFTVDSSPERQGANDQSLYELESHLGAMDKTLYTVPFVYQYNKQDVVDALDLDALQETLNKDEVFPHQSTCALSGEGIGPLVQKATDLILATLL